MPQRIAALRALPRCGPPDHGTMPLGPADIASVPDQVHAFRLWTSATLPAREHVHPHHEAIICLRGIYRVRVGGEEWTVRPGDMARYPAGLVHHPLLPRRRGIEFFVVQWWGGLAPVAGVGSDPNGRARFACEWLISHLGGSGPQSGIVPLLLGTLISLPTPITAREGGEGIIQRLCFEMREKLDAPLSLGELAELSGWSPQHLIRRFRTATGQTPMAWFQEQRLRDADRRLAAGETIDDVARRCGYRHGRNLLRAMRRRGLGTDGLHIRN